MATPASSAQLPRPMLRDRRGHPRGDAVPSVASAWGHRPGDNGVWLAEPMPEPALRTERFVAAAVDGPGAQDGAVLTPTHGYRAGPSRWTARRRTTAWAANLSPLPGGTE